jgi:predicted enzyme related to lactoylglutathione lyase
MKITSYKAGTPCWIDLGTPDTAGTSAFFGGLFGWTATEGAAETGGYVIYTLDGAPVAGAGPLMSPDQPPVWTSYFATDDVDATAAAVEAAGGRAVVAPMDVLDIGRMGIFIDTGGAVFGAWQKGTFYGAGVVNEPGALAWNELMTRDVEGATAFYARALGMGAKASDVSGEVAYTEFQVAGATVGGMMSMDGPQWPADLPPHWMVYFATADCDATVEKIEQLGGSVSVPPTDIPVGRFAIAADPNGAFFSVIALAAAS